MDSEELLRANLLAHKLALRVIVAHMPPAIRDSLEMAARTTDAALLNSGLTDEGIAIIGDTLRELAEPIPDVGD